MIRYLFICVALLGWGQGECWGVTASDILDQLQKRYSASDFEADFVQKTHLKAVDMVDTAEGHLYYRPAGMMHWHYKTPEEYFIITDGETVWLFRPEENQVMVGRAADYFGGENGTDFFAKPGELSKKFQVEIISETKQEKDLHVLRLVPREKQSNLAEFNLFVSRESAEIIKAVTHNDFGDETSLIFQNYKFGQELDSSLFVFKIPKDADVVVLEGEQSGANKE